MASPLDLPVFTEQNQRPFNKIIHEKNEHSEEKLPELFLSMKHTRESGSKWRVQV